MLLDPLCEDWICTLAFFECEKPDEGVERRFRFDGIRLVFAVAEVQAHFAYSLKQLHSHGSHLSAIFVRVDRRVDFTNSRKPWRVAYPAVDDLKSIQRYSFVVFRCLERREDLI